MHLLTLAGALLLGSRAAIAEKPAAVKEGPSVKKAPSKASADRDEAKTPAVGQAEGEEKPRRGSHRFALGARADLRAWREADPPGDPPEDRVRLTALRLEGEYRFERWARLLVEVDFAPLPPRRSVPWSPSLRDAYARIGGKSAWVQAGHFKPPTSAVESESSFALPTVRRDALNDALEGADVSGRRLGLAGGLAGLFGGARVIGGVFYTPLLLQTTSGAVSAVVRGEVELEPLTFGAFALGGTRDSAFLPYGTMGVDAAAESKGNPFALRTWAELLAGTAPQSGAPYLAGRAIVAPRWGGLSRGGWYVEPYALASATTADPSGARPAPWFGGAAGLNLGMWRLWRAQAEFEGRSDGAWTALIGLSAAASVAFER